MRNIRIHLPLLLFLLLSSLTVLFLNDNPGRALVLLGALCIWLFLGFKLKSFSLSSLLLLLFIFPFNITKNLEFLSDPYVDNVLVNFLIPHLSILDLFSVLSLFAFWYEGKFVLPQKQYITFVLLLLFSLTLNFSWLSVISIFRVVLYLQAITMIVKGFEKAWSGLILKVLVAVVVIQVLVAGYQVFYDRVLGIGWLGESQVISGSIVSSFLNIGEEVTLRGYGTFPHPNVLAGFLLFNLFAGLHYIKSQQKVGWWFVGLCFLGLILTFSRLHLILGVVLILTLLVEIKGKVFSILLFDRFAHLISGGDVSVSERVMLLKSSITIVQQNPFGTGFGMFIKGMEGLAPRTSGGILLLQPVHNILMLLIAENGLIIGCLLFLYLLYFWFMCLVKRYKGMLGIMAFLSVILIAMSDHYFLTVPQGIMLLLLTII